ncbi:MAG: MFS transporter [Candidatus Izemoplasmatales bacterium]|nr:MFS transporter [Candidatus Izemoplasmatales bacterium]
MMRREYVNGSDHVSVRSGVAYGSGDMAFTFGTAITGFYLLIFLTNVVGLKGYMASGIIFFGFVWDAITDPIIGFHADRIRSKFGRRRILMLASAIPLGLSFFAVFALSTLISRLTPGLLGLGNDQVQSVMWLKAFLVLIIYLIFYLCYTLAYIPYISLINDMTKSYRERTKLTGYRMVATILATIIAVAIPDIIMGDVTLTHSGEKFILISAIFGVAMVLIIIIAVLGTFEMPPNHKESTRKFRFYQDFLECFKDRNFRKSALAFMCSLSAIFVLQDTIQYYVNYWLLSPELFLPLAGAVLVLGFLSVPLWVFISNRIGKRRTLYLGTLCWIIAFVTFYFLPQLPYREVALDFSGERYILPLTMGDAIQSFPIFGWLAVLILGLGMGNIHLVAYGMYPDAISILTQDHPEREGSYFGAVSFLQKVGIGLATLLIGPILDLSGYQAKPSWEWFELLTASELTIDPTWLYVQSATSAQFAVKIAFCLMPIIMMILAAVVVRGYRGDELLNQQKGAPTLK